METDCQIPDCLSTTIHLRGLCRACYTFAASLVRYGLTTWEQLQAAGCVGSADGNIQSPKRPLRLEWFAKGVGVTPDVLQSELRRRTTEYLQSRRVGWRRGKKKETSGGK